MVVTLRSPFQLKDSSRKCKIRVTKESSFCSNVYDPGCKESAPFTDEEDTAKKKVNRINILNINAQKIYWLIKRSLAINFIPLAS